MKILTDDPDWAPEPGAGAGDCVPQKAHCWQREGMMLLIAGLSQSMTRNISTLRSIVTRCLAVGVLLCISCVGIVGTSALVASSTTADAPGGGAVAEVAVAEEAAFAAAAFVPRRP